ncbi:hypothetical protein [Candidatus Kinetoplastidibacterium blastocrithidiae]|uniref:hypothetical protein n=1 Tax=Candidatus Kinetoplastidibacterium blastocrithidiae TaxID=233181 RepID=UPI0004AEDA30|nr:hypothetical protein [Candidatus Kinetoplastibacterium blastocrithidii]
MKNFRKSDWNSIPNWGKEDFVQFWSIFLSNCQYISGHEKKNSINDYVKVKDWKKYVLLQVHGMESSTSCQMGC